MSYVLGWKTRSNVYLAADSMLTSSPVSIDAYSSFGERQFTEGKVSIAERGLKIVTDEDLAIGLCGDFERARDLAAMVFDAYGRTRDPLDALRQMAVSNGPFPLQHEARLVVAWRGDPFPRLFSFNQDGHGGIREFSEGEGVPLGSVRAMHKGLTQELLKHVSVLEREGSAPYLTAVLGMLQSLGLHDYLLPDRVGGCFTGLRVSRDSMAWQPDLLYLVEEPDKPIWPAIATCIRDGNLIAASTVTNEVRIFATTARPDSNPFAWFEKWSDFARGYIKNRSFDYVVLLGLSRWVVIVLEMRRALESRMLRFSPASEAANGVRWFHLHSQLIHELRRGFASSPEPDTRDFRFGYMPYEAPSRDLVRTD